MNGINQEFIQIRGKPVPVDSLHLDDQVILIIGKFFKTAMLKEEWYEDVHNPEAAIRALKTHYKRPDIFTFWQRLPDTDAKHDYYKEWESIAVIFIKSFDDWWENELSSQTRNKAKKAEKKGITIKVVDFDDELVNGIMHVFNEAPVRRGKPFWHYGKDFETVKGEWSADLDRCDYIGAYFEGKLVGFIKQIYTENFAILVQIISMLKHRNRYINNALIAKAVEVCDLKGISYLTYSQWRRGSHGDFQRRNGFKKMLLPRYYVPLTLKGKILLSNNLHRGVAGVLSEKTYNKLLKYRGKLYEKKMQRNTLVQQ